MPSYSAGEASIKIKPSFKNFVRDAETELKSMNFRVDVTMGLNTQAARAEIDALREEAGRRVDFHMSADTATAADEIAALRREANRNASMRIDADTAAARAEIEALRRQAASSGTLTPRVNGTNARRDAEKIAGELKTALTLQGKVLGVVGGAGAVADLLAIAGAAAKASHALALIPAVGFAGLAGIGSLAVGASGISGAFKAASAQSASAGSDAGEAIDKANAVTEARYAEVQADRTAVTAAKDLDEAYKTEGRSLRDLNDSLESQKLSAEGASLSVEEAAKRLAQVQHDPSSDADARKQADLTYREAVQHLKEQQEKTSDLAQDTQVANAKGIEGSDQIVAAKQKVTDATHGQVKAQEELAKALRDQAKGSSSQSAVDKALAKLSPNAKDLVAQVRALGPAWTDTRQAAQDALTSGMGSAVTKLATEQLPGLKAGMVGINTAINLGLRASITELSSEANKADFKTSLGNVATGFQNAAKGAAPLTDAITKLITVGTDFLPKMGDGFAKFATDFNSKIQIGAANGSLKKWIQEGVDSAKTFFGILRDGGSIIASVFRAADADGVSKSLKSAADNFAALLKSGQGQEKMRDFFANARENLDKIKPVLADLPSILSGVYGGFQTWAAISLPFLKTAGDLLGAHPALVQDVVTAYLAFKTIGPIFDGVRYSMGLARDTMSGFRGGTGTTGTAVSGLGTLLGGAGPLGIGLITAGAGLGLEYLINKHNAAKDAAEAQQRAVEALGQTLDAQTGRATEDTLKATSEELQKGGYLTRAQTLGVDPHNLVLAATGVDPSAKQGINDSLVKKIIEQSGSSGQWQFAKNAGLSDTEIAQALAGVPAAVQKYADTKSNSRAYLPDLKELKGTLNDIGESAATLGGELNNTDSTLSKLGENTRQVYEGAHGTHELTQQGKQDFDNLGLAVLSVPDEKTVLVKALTADQQAAVEKLGDTVLKLPDGTFKLTLNDQQTLTDIQKITSTQYSATMTLGLDVDPVELAKRLAAGINDPAVRAAAKAYSPESGYQHYAAGGPVSGGTPGRDSVPILAMPGEHMLTTSDVTKLGGQGGVYQFRQALQSGKVRGFADGGAIDTTDQTQPAAATTSLVPGLISYAQSLNGSPYGGDLDCSGAQSKLANKAVGRDPAAGRFSTANEGEYLSGLGFKDGVGNSSTFRIGWVNSADMAGGGHTAGTLPNNVNVESGGATAKFMYGGQAVGAADNLFTNRAYLVMDSSGGSGAYVPGQSTPGTTSVLNPQAALPGKATDANLTIAQDKAAVDTANSERNAVYANPASTAADKQAEDIKYQKAQNALESAQTKNDTSSLSLKGVLTKGAGFLADGLLSAFGLENSIFSENNVYNKAANSIYDHYNSGNSSLTGGYSYVPQNLPTIVTTSTPQSDAPVSDPTLASQVPGATTDTTDATAGKYPAAVEKWRPAFKSVLAGLGKPASWLDPGLAQASFESGGNEKARNDADTNGRGGTQTVLGLMQMLQENYDKYRSAQFGGGIFDGTSNFAASVLYTADRYGDATGVWGKGHGYADGGLIRGIGGSRGDGVPIWASPDEFVVNAYDATRNRDALEAINAGRWSPVSIDPSQLRSTGSATNGGTSYNTYIQEPRVADVQDLADLVERRAHVQSMGQLAAIG
jgi:SLT domain-containing protein/predicted transcriptional regulator